VLEVIDPIFKDAAPATPSRLSEAEALGLQLEDPLMVVCKGRLASHRIQRPLAAFRSALTGSRIMQISETPNHLARPDLAHHGVEFCRVTFAPDSCSTKSRTFE
jgi:hypothetical protein